MTPRRRVLALRVAVWLGCLAPLAWVLHRAFLGDGLGANPPEEAEHWAGRTTLLLLLVTLSVTPVRVLTGWNDLQKVRRLLGLFTFFYAFLHFSAYIVLDQFFGWSYIVEDIAERPYILAGFTGFLLLAPLAVTSTKGWIRRLGRSWVRLHRLAYVAAVLGVFHWLWLVKADLREPLMAGAVLTALLAFRIGRAARRPWEVWRAAGGAAGGAARPRPRGRSSPGEARPARSAAGD